MRRAVVSTGLLLTVLVAAAPPAQAACEAEQEPGFPVPTLRCFQAVSTPVGGGACAVMFNPQPDPPGLPFRGACAAGVFGVVACHVPLGGIPACRMAG